MPFEREIEVARRAAREAAALAIRHQAAGLKPIDKADGSPVTAADRECETLISRLLEEAFPDDGLLGEEGANKPSRNGRRWIIDPIDGTRDFIRGLPLWCVLIALEEHGEVMAGVVHLPLLGRTCWASRNGGAFRNDSRMRASSITEPAKAVLCLNGVNFLSRSPYAAGIVDWAATFYSVRSLGGAPDAMLVAAGEAEVWIEPRVAPWDLAPLQVILEEAGAVFFDFHGQRSIHSGNAAACAPGLEHAVRAYFQAPNGA